MRSSDVPAGATGVTPRAVEAVTRVPRSLRTPVPRTRALSVLGSTGSIGVQALSVAEEEGMDVAALACGRRARLLAGQIKKWRPRYVSVLDESSRKSLIHYLDAASQYRPVEEKDVPLFSDLPARADPESGASPPLLMPSSPDLPVVGVGRRGAVLAASLRESDTVIGAITGFAALEPVLAAADAGKKIALANKECLVAAGRLVRRRAAGGGAWILPVDSEHSAVWQCALAAPEEALDRVTLTCSGGPFFGYTKEALAGVTPEQALRHPTWSMGQKITIDSATLMNKGFEVIEACRLFDLPPERVDVVIHRESIVHSFASFVDGSVLAQLGKPDMKGPIRFALTFPDRAARPASEPIDFLLETSGALTFHAPDEDVFPTLRMAREALRQGGLMPLVLNAANEAAVRLFLQKKIPFTEIFSRIEGALDAFHHMSSTDESSFDDMMTVHTDVQADVIRRATKEAR